MSKAVSKSKNSNFVFTGWHMLFMIVSFFGIIISMNVWMMVNAVRSYPGVDTKQSYRQGLEYNETLHARERQRALEWSAAIAVSDTHKIILTIADKNGLPVRGLNVTGLLKHPSETDLDVPLKFHQNAQSGLYEVDIDSKLMGKRWLLTKAFYANANSDASVFETRNELWLK